MALKATPEWKETCVIEDEEGRTFVFDDGARGGSPLIMYVPPVETWHTSVPPWLGERRAEVIQALVDHGFRVLDERSETPSR